ncbi:putative HLH DNA binding protein [Arabidopsis thaliana]|jgi:vacuolar-type H+-ATPase subunit H|uniref:Putative transcription factor bHLH107 n=1 Tax=Arabidopsis thaliana TaxID=3702 RepID=BH107_ARATH|nr:basic helix-loop-helix (bHLH) DNA-binding superfamily protein [Arabidopsis thaliana]Q9LET0.1 RecName: Full=Putative transcription factor bHLH107; AltName: Full=Basic helix-loop-helix protein 107; Short=AtbHLH107; Short=bHLH 107; AltName: Full=Transcription factor EN 55; AltName: Full=bHLH transcription factor bHLH107 [Arabidopsis thaliana]AEE79563.1 basic helix-loop-helix (bHLH) DNA-binding superfamily protein [Arabidopsis thaliana]CAC00740.1 putative HLH DNA binding protein [Arabidopsis thal|eukprot:NP_191236.1 basic helix-loop-helix (bHLH) DNA-binding superfamily protein [Arabidopsis thaliana]
MQPEVSDQIFYAFLTGGLCASSTSTTVTSSSDPFATVYEDKALASLRNHKEAERKRRARINSHLNKLRKLLSCNSKTDKSTLLAKVVQRVKELKQQTLEITDETIPSETDEISVLNIEDCSRGDDRRIIFKVSFCCEDRPELLKDLMETLKSLQMETLFADMTTVGGRTRNVLVVAADKEHHGVQSVNFLQNALKSLLERSSKSVMVGHGGGGGEERLKRRRALDHIIMV